MSDREHFTTASAGFWFDPATWVEGRIPAERDALITFLHVVTIPENPPVKILNAHLLFADAGQLRLPEYEEQEESRLVVHDCIIEALGETPRAIPWLHIEGSSFSDKMPVWRSA